MSISQSNDCYVCKKSSILARQRGEQVLLHICPQCGIKICNSCFDDIEKTQQTPQCPNCGESFYKSRQP